MKISKDIELAKKDYPGMYHVISSNEVHSFEKYLEAKIDFRDATNAEAKIGTGFRPVLVKFAESNKVHLVKTVTPFQSIPDAKD